MQTLDPSQFKATWTYFSIQILDFVIKKIIMPIFKILLCDIKRRAERQRAYKMTYVLYQYTSVDLFVCFANLCICAGIMHGCLPRGLASYC